MGDKNQWNYYLLQNFYIIARDGDNGNTNPNAQKCKLLFAFYVIMHTRVKLKEDSHKDYPLYLVHLHGLAKQKRLSLHALLKPTTFSKTTMANT